MALFDWDPAKGQLHAALRTPGRGDLSYIRIDGATPPWQLGEGWYGLEGAYRWIAPFATARADAAEADERDRQVK